MSEAPERIWAWEYKGNSPWGPIKPDLDVVTNGAEYVRADMLQEIFVRYSKAESDRIEELEAKLAKAVEELEDMQKVPYSCVSHGILMTGINLSLIHI